MPLCHKNGRSLLFVHIPKTGGTSVNHFLEEHTALSFRFRGTPPGLRCPPQHLEAKSLKAILPIGSIDGIFSIVRHPEDRLVSEFLWRYQKSKYLPIVESPSNPKWQKALRTLYFCKWARKALSRCQRDPYYLSNHIRPQTNFILCDRHKIFKIEDGIDGAIDFISETLGLPEKRKPVKYMNASMSHPIAIPKFVRRRIETFYAEDYERFGYERRS